jgi:hypothetical protein
MIITITERWDRYPSASNPERARETKELRWTGEIEKPAYIPEHASINVARNSKFKAEWSVSDFMRISSVKSTAAKHRFYLNTCVTTKRARHTHTLSTSSQHNSYRYFIFERTDVAQL